jgi:hypothetical protein
MMKTGEPFCMADLIRRASVRKLRLHACGCMRLHSSADTPAKWLKLVETAERYADGEVTDRAFAKARQKTTGDGRPREWGGDIRWAFQSNNDLQTTWDMPIRDNRTFTPKDGTDYRAALPRYRVFEELIGPDPLPAFAPEWRTDTVKTLAKQMYDAREFSAMPILADALQDAGCDNEAILAHCRSAEHPHLRGCWVIDLVFEKK